MKTVQKVNSMAWHKDESIENLWWAIEFQLSVAQNSYELNAWVGLLTKVCNLTHDRFLTDMIEPKRN